MDIRTKWDNFLLKNGKYEIVLRVACALLVGISVFRMLGMYARLEGVPYPEIVAGQLKVLIPLGCMVLSMVTPRAGAFLTAILFFITAEGTAPVLISLVAIILFVQGATSATIHCVMVALFPLCMMITGSAAAPGHPVAAYLYFAVAAYTGFKMSSSSKYMLTAAYACMCFVSGLYAVNGKALNMWAPEAWKISVFPGVDFEMGFAQVGEMLLPLIVVLVVYEIIAAVFGKLLVSEHPSLTKMPLDIREGALFAVLAVLLIIASFASGMVEGLTSSVSIVRVIIEVILAYVVTRPVASYKVARAMSQEHFEDQIGQTVVSTGDVVRSTSEEISAIADTLYNDKNYNRVVFMGKRPVKAVMLYGNEEMNKRYVVENIASQMQQKIEYIESSDLIREMADAGTINWEKKPAEQVCYYINHFDGLFYTDAGKNTAMKIMEHIEETEEDKSSMFIIGVDDPSLIPDDCYDEKKISRVVHAKISDSIIYNDTYAILDVIGQGGFGEVFSAWHMRLNEKVVLKKVSVDQPTSVSGKHEVELLKRVKHMYLPKIYDVFDADKALYLVTDFIPGKSFADYLKEGRRFEEKYVLIWAKQLADAVGYLHNMQPPIIHSDIKPGNIMLTPDGDICLIDFNISAILDKNTARSVGTTPGYSPIEQYGFVKNYLNILSRKGIDVEAFSKAKVSAGYLSSKLSPSLSNSLMQSASASLPQQQTPYGKPEKWEEETAAADWEEETAAADWEEETAALGWEDDETMAADDKTMFVDENAPVSEPVITPEQMSLVVDNKSFLIDCMQKGYGVRSDIYAIGATLYHLLTGVKPSINFFGIKPAHEFADSVSPDFAAVIETCMRIDPDERYSTVKELKEALDKVDLGR